MTEASLLAGRLPDPRYRTLADSMPQMVWATDANGAHFYYNRRWYEFTGLSEQESLGFGFANALHPDDKQRTLEHWQRAWRDGASYEIEYRFRRHDGAYHWFIGRAEPVRDAEGRIVEWVGTCTDIDDQKRAAEVQAFLSEASKLLASTLDYEETLAQVAELAVPHIADWCAVDVLVAGEVRRVAVAHVDPAKVELAWELQRKYPFDPDARTGVAEVLRSGRAEMIAEIPEELVRSLISDPELLEIMLGLGLKSSMVVPLVTRGRTLGAITMVAAESGRLFTPADLALAEELGQRAAVAVENAELYRELRRFRETLDDTLDCVFMFEPDTLRFFYVNRGAVEQVGYTHDELLGMTPLDIKPAFTEDSFRTVLQPLLTGEQSAHTFQTTHRHKDGHEVPVEIVLQYVAPPDDEGRFVAVVRDITERERAEAALRSSEQRYRELAEMLEARNRELDQFAYVTSHDLKAPLRGIANLAQWVEEDLGDAVTDQARQHLDLLRGRVNRMEGLIDGILQYSRVGRAAGTVERVEVAELLDNVVDLLAPPETASITIEPGMPVLFSERLPLQQVFQNLIGNALKHGGNDVCVTVSCRERGNTYEFAVADDGPGIPPQYHERIFGIFQTLASRDKVEGSGLGLALIKKIVEHHNGRVWLESVPGAGATFFFSWPKERRVRA
jgi:PAS domain S-box-containing protein